MKKNGALYILLAFLIIANGFFLFLFLNKPGKNSGNPENFIAKELKFDEQQLERFRQLNETHSEDRRRYADAIKELREALFDKIRDENVTDKSIDSLTDLIGKQEQTKSSMTFYHFRAIRSICNEDQKMQFDKIIREGLHRGHRVQGPPRSRPEKDERRPPRSRSEKDDRRPPPPPRD